MALPWARNISSWWILGMHVGIQEYLKLRNSPCISVHHFFSCAHAHIFKFYSVEMIDDVYEILRSTKYWADRWRLSYILAVSREA